MPYIPGATSLAPTSDGSTITDYRQKTLQEIQKIAAVNPAEGQALLASYASRTPAGRGFFGGLLGAIGNVAGKVVEPFIRINAMLANPFVNEETGEEDNWAVDVWQGFTGEQRSTFKDVLESNDIAHGTAATAIGFVMDVGLDPTTYIGVGALGMVKGGIRTSVEKATVAGAKATLLGHSEPILKMAAGLLDDVSEEVAATAAKAVTGNAKTIGESLATKGRVLPSGGRVPGGQTIVQFGDDFNLQKATEFADWYKANGVNELAADALGGMAAHTQQESLERLYMRWLEREANELGAKLGQDFVTYGSIRGAPTVKGVARGSADDVWKSTQGVSWTRAQREAWARNGASLNPKQLAQLADDHWLKEIATEAEGWAAAQGHLSRNLAASIGGVRFKFGIPFGRQIFKKSEIPWIGGRWQTAAIEYNGRMNFRTGRYFRGMSAMNKMDQAIGDAAIDFKADDLTYWMETSQAKLRHKMYEEGRDDVYEQVFGTKGISMTTAMSERLGVATEAITPGARAYRRGGFYGGTAADRARQGTLDKLTFISRHIDPKVGGINEKEWARAADLLEKEGPEVHAKIIEYMEGLDEYGVVKLEDLPEYARPIITRGREWIREVWADARMEGADIGDWYEVALMRRARVAHSRASSEIKTLQTRLEKALAEGKDVDVAEIKTMLDDLQATRKAAETASDPSHIQKVMDAAKSGPDAAAAEFKAIDDEVAAIDLAKMSRSAIANIDKRMTQLRKTIKQATEPPEVLDDAATELQGLQTLKNDLRETVSYAQTSRLQAAERIKRMQEYDEWTALYGGKRMDKASPLRFFPRRMAQPQRESLIGQLVNPGPGMEGISYGAAKAKISSLERTLVDLTEEEATAAMKKAFPQLEKYTTIWEHNFIRTMGNYLDEVSDAVRDASLGKGVNSLLKAMDSFDNGSVIRMFDEDSASALARIQELEARIKAGIKDDKTGSLDWVKTQLNRLTGKRAQSRKSAQQIIEDNLKSTIPGRWRNSPYLDKTEVVSISTLKRLKEFDREGIARIKSPGAQKALEEDVAKNGFNEPLILIADDEGRVYLGEGNHRLIAAEKAGFEGAPVRVSVNKSTPANATVGSRGDLAGRKGVGTKIMKYREESYIPADMRPSDVLPDELHIPNIAQLPEEMQRDLQELLHTLNAVHARITVGETPVKRALTDSMNMTAADKRLFVPLDVPGFEDAWMHPLMAAEFHRAMKGPYKSTNRAQQFWRGFQGPWKEYATYYWPGFHARNNMGAAFNNFLQGVQPFHYRDATRALKASMNNEDGEYWRGQVWKRGISLDGGPKKDVTYGELMVLARDRHITGAGVGTYGDIHNSIQSIEPGIGLRQRGRVSRRLSEGGTFRGIKVPGLRKKITVNGKTVDISPQSGMESWRNAGIGWTVRTENWHRMASFITGLEQASGDTVAARAAVMMRHGDYEDLTDMEQTIKDVLPFYKWMRTNLPFQIRQMMESPGKQAAVFDFQNALVDPEDQGYLPSWMTNSFMVPNPLHKGDSKNGSDYLLFDLPLMDIKMGANEFFGSFLPIVKPFFENFVMKKSIFTGAPLEGNKYVPLSTPLQYGLGDALDFFGVAERDSEGRAVISDQWENILSAFPIFGKFRTMLLSDPDRIAARLGAMGSMVSGVKPQHIGFEELNNTEAEWFYNEVKPVVDSYRARGFILPTAEDFAGITLVDPNTKPNPATALESLQPVER